MGFLIEIVSTPKLVLLINGKTFQTNEKGYVTFNSDMIRVDPQSQNVFEFDRFLSDKMTNEMKKILYSFVLNNRRFGVSELADLLNMDKYEVKEYIIAPGLKTSVLVKNDTQWRVNVAMKDILKSYLESCQEEQKTKNVKSPLNVLKDLR